MISTLSNTKKYKFSSTNSYNYLFKNIKSLLTNIIIILCIIVGILSILYILKIIYDRIKNLVLNKNLENRIESFSGFCVDGGRLKGFFGKVFSLFKRRNPFNNPESKEIFNKLLLEYKDGDTTYENLINNFPEFFDLYKKIRKNNNFIKNTPDNVPHMLEIANIINELNYDKTLFYGYNDFYDYMISDYLFRNYLQDFEIPNKKGILRKLKFCDIPQIHLHKYINTNNTIIIDFILTNKAKPLNILILDTVITELRNKKYTLEQLDSGEIELINIPTDYFNDTENNANQENDFTQFNNRITKRISSNLIFTLSEKINSIIKNTVRGSKYFRASNIKFQNYYNKNLPNIHPNNAFKIYFNNLHYSLINQTEKELYDMDSKTLQFTNNLLYRNNIFFEYDDIMEFTNEGELQPIDGYLDKLYNPFHYSSVFQYLTKNCDINDNEKDIIDDDEDYNIMTCKYISNTNKYQNIFNIRGYVECNLLTILDTNDVFDSNNYIIQNEFINYNYFKNYSYQNYNDYNLDIKKISDIQLTNIRKHVNTKKNKNINTYGVTLVNKDRKKSSLLVNEDFFYYLQSQYIYKDLYEIFISDNIVITLYELLNEKLSRGLIVPNLIEKSYAKPIGNNEYNLLNNDNDNKYLINLNLEINEILEILDSLKSSENNNNILEVVNNTLITEQNYNKLDYRLKIFMNRFQFIYLYIKLK